jgi:hypothetical protein
MAVDMTPQPGDTSINLPITFDYKGGRGENKKGKIILSIADVLLTVVLTVGCALNENLEIWMRFLLPCIIFYIGLFILRFFVFRELWFSDVYETLKATDYDLKLDQIWQIFDIDFEYPYICYFKNGYKGIFVRMEKDAITGKVGDAQFEHYSAIGDAYNVAHSLNMNIVHIDYMDNVGNDTRMQKLYDDLVFVENPDMQEMLIDIYSNLQDEMSQNYASFDIYLFLTRDKLNNFVYNMQTVCNYMLGGNFITYKVLDRFEISRVCVALFNLHDFSIVEACENVLSGVEHHGVIPIKVKHGDGTEEIFNKTTAEKKVIAAENARKQKERLAEQERQKAEAKQRKKNAKLGIKPKEKKKDMTELDLFDEEQSNKKVSLEKKDKSEEVKIDLTKEIKESKKSDSSNSDDDLNLF